MTRTWGFYSWPFQGLYKWPPFGAHQKVGKKLVGNLYKPSLFWWPRAPDQGKKIYIPVSPWFPSRVPPPPWRTTKIHRFDAVELRNWARLQVRTDATLCFRRRGLFRLPSGWREKHRWGILSMKTHFCEDLLSGLAGFLIHRCGNVPKIGDTITIYTDYVEDHC